MNIVLLHRERAFVIRDTGKLKIKNTYLHFVNGKYQNYNKNDKYQRYQVELQIGID